jgi:hypothetical protein
LFYITEDRKLKTKTLHANEKYKEHASTPQEDNLTRETKTKMIRRKMMEARKRKSQQDFKKALLCRSTKPVPKTWKGEKLVSARDVGTKLVQDRLELFVVGADVQALYPSLSDIEVAVICYIAVINSKIKFDNINY